MCSCWNPNQPAQEDLLLRARRRSWVCPFLPIFSTPSVWGRGSWRSGTKPCLYFRGCAGLGLCNIFVPLLWSLLPFSCEREPHTGFSAAFGSRRDFCPQLQNSVWQTAWFVPDLPAGLVCTTVMIVGASWALSRWVADLFTVVTCAIAEKDVQFWKCRFWVHLGNSLRN